MERDSTITLTPGELGFRVLQDDPARTGVDEAATALKRFLQARRPGLARILHVEPGADAVRVSAAGAGAEDALEELRNMLRSPTPPEPTGEIEVDPGAFRVAVTQHTEHEPERVILQSRVRSFPYPVCEWFDLSTGLLTLTETRVVYAPEDLIMDEKGLAGGHLKVTDLVELRHACRGNWWDVPCLMLETEKAVQRYGWPARRDEPELEFHVGEWLDALRSLLPPQEDEEPAR